MGPDDEEMPSDGSEVIVQDSPAQNPSESAPAYPVPHRSLAAVEVPAVVKNVDRTIKAFGRGPSLKHVPKCQTKSTT